jgi:hypothetical protein
MINMGMLLPPDVFASENHHGGHVMKFILGALGAVTLLVGIAGIQPAEARCFWNGVAMECYHHPFFFHHHHWWHHGYRPY